MKENWLLQRIEEHLKFAPTPLTPTQIGLEIGLPYHTASSKTCYHLKKLVATGKVTRNPDATYVWNNVKPEEEKNA